MLKKIGIALCIGLVTFCLIYGISSRTRLFTGMERGILNGLFYLREPGIHEPNPFVSDRVKLLGYNEDSIAVIGKWPWKRYVHAEFLEKIARFSPETVFFDLIFAKPETVPQYVENKLDPHPEALRRVQEAFAGMDQEFADAIARHDNVYLDLQLVEEARDALPADYLDRIAFNERVILDHSLPAETVQSPMLFRSLEPILDDYVKNAHPVVINVLTDDDGVIRLFPLFYTYRMGDGTLRNVFTVALVLAQRYFHVGVDQVTLLSDRVVLNGAKVPVLNPDTRRTVMVTRDFRQVAGLIVNPSPPSDDAYNPNLYRFLVRQAASRTAAGQGATPHFPLHVAPQADGRLEIVDGWEVLDAAERVQADAIHLVLYETRDLHIETPITGFFHINYAGKDERFSTDPETGELEIFTPIPTEGYSAVYTMDDLPDLPDPDPDGRPVSAADVDGLGKWFFGYCLKKAQAVTDRAAAALGQAVPDEGKLRAYLDPYPDQRRYVDWAAFFKSTGLEPEKTAFMLDRYPAWARSQGWPDTEAPTLEGMLEALTEAYREGFDRYYNRFIFTGGNATGLGDVQQTPYAGMYGVNVIINAFNTLATQNPLRMTAEMPRLDPMLLAAVCLVGCLLYGAFGIRVGSLFFVATLLGTLGGSSFVFVFNSLFVSTTPLLFANGIIFVSVLAYKLLTEEKDKQFLKDTFSTYLAPELINEMHQTRTMPRLGGEARRITAFFTDIQGFSTFSEKLTAPQLVELLNEYLTAMTDILIAERGTLDKYEGDAILAFFGAPLELRDQELRACRVAVSMQRKLEQLRGKWEKERVPPGDPVPNQRQVPHEEWAPENKWPMIVHRMRMRIGVNTGEIVVGNMGSTTRMNYTMMGDPVNLAARLEAAAKQYGIYNLVSEYTLDVDFPDEHGTRKKVMDLVETRYLDRIIVVGKREPVRVYELFAMEGELTADEAALIQTFQEAMAFYLNMEWDLALEGFGRSRVLERFPFEKTTPSDVFMERCRTFKADPPVPPGRKWDGVYRLTRK